MLSSRLGRAPDARPEWFACLRALLRRCRDSDRTVVTAIGTAAEPFVTRGAERYCLPIVRLATNDQPADVAVVRECDELFVLSARAGGNVAQLIERWLADADRVPSAVWLADHDALIPRRLRTAWLARGASRWHVMDELLEVLPAPTADSTINATRDSSSAPITTVPDGEWLLHCTRRHEGPWPDQSFVEYLDELIDDSPLADRSSLASLRRILTERRIRASNAAIRDGHRVVSFTAESLGRLSRLRSFRAHRHRWDFEPYGVALRRDWLEARGARPVVYADEQDWERLPTVDRPFFQRRTTRARSDGLATDWTVEREWRVLDDVDLAEVSDTANEPKAWVFVPDERSARSIGFVTSWPVVLVPGASDT